MYSTTMTSMPVGIRAVPIRVEVDISAGMPAFEMVGFLASEVREARERVRTALHNCGIALPAKRITVNLSPANIRKSGTGFDVAIAVALLAAMGLVDGERAADALYVGELNLRGDILPVSGVLPIVSDAAADGTRRFVVPAENMWEARLVQTAEIRGFSSLTELLGFLRGEPYTETEAGSAGDKPCAEPEAAGEMPHEDSEAPEADFSEVNGQAYLRRVAEVAASGMHNLLMIGPPGAGKTMIAERMATILPPLVREERLELSKIYSVRGMLGKRRDLIARRPFRSPHHTASLAGLVGGGKDLRPGEISLAHKGVLFLDELTEFEKSTVETLRQPLEEHEIHLVRAAGSVSYPSDFLLVAAMNPCNCGYYPDLQRCCCTPAMLRRYIGRVSKPLLDRIDICAEAPAVTYRELAGKAKNESSADIRSRVQECHELQLARYQGQGFCHNSRIPAAQIADYCALGEKEERYMEQVFGARSMTARSYHKVLRVARTVADLDHSDPIKIRHLSEAACYFGFDEKFWGGM
ncbi:MAG: YifB family Mg chelatase-like AAA ATPase [Agathobacter sp.]|nr:YifB family Mg chelatase-like AAA ATPase [Agathobacter sp.]